MTKHRPKRPNRPRIDESLRSVGRFTGSGTLRPGAACESVPAKTHRESRGCVRPRRLRRLGRSHEAVLP
jgi:hypothetical protein